MGSVMTVEEANQGFDVRRIAAVIRDERLNASVRRLTRALGKASIEIRLVEEERCLANGEPVDMGDGWQPDAVLALGGDGTVLRALNAFPGVPVLAVNFGHLGFLTAGDESDLERLMFRLLSGDFILDERLMLRSTLRGQDYDVVNEVLIKGATRMVSIDIFIDDQLVHSLRGDGVAVGTPTGSTAYLLSTGSPIVMPTVECMILCGINEFRFASRALVIDANKTIRLRVSPDSREQDLFVCHDGRDRHEAHPGDELVIRRHASKARLIFFEPNYFFNNLKARLNW